MGVHEHCPIGSNYKGNLKNVLIFALKCAIRTKLPMTPWMELCPVPVVSCQSSALLFAHWRWLVAIAGILSISFRADLKCCLLSVLCLKFASNRCSLPPLVINNKQSLQIGTQSIYLLAMVVQIDIQCLPVFTHMPFNHCRQSSRDKCRIKWSISIEWGWRKCMKLCY